MDRSNDEEVQFFDAQDDVVLMSDANYGVTDNPETDSSPVVEGLLRDFGYELWTRSPHSVRERRSKFLKWMELSLDQRSLENENLVDVREDEMSRMKDGVGSVTESCGFMDDFFSSRSSMSCLSSLSSSMSCLSSLNSSKSGLVENSACQDRDSVSGVGQHVENDDGREVGLDRLVVSDEYENVAGVSPACQREIGKEFEETGVSELRTKKARKGWLRRLRLITCLMDRQQGESNNERQEGGVAFSSCRIQRVKVRQCRKQTKELSALYTGQDIQAHEGPIFTMKFSPDGQYLASAGEDGIVRLWQVVEDERHNEINIPEVDTSCIYFTVNDLSELTPLFIDKDKMSKVKTLKKTSDSACIIFPPKVFRLLEKPLHEFQGHRGEILDLSWSKNNVSEVIDSVI